ncbi:hypothetical protein K435DRAFT_795339 [Dendrothele bispora CBS 962.96]|uniref:Uncharacterized protein n=1 Tax=Dendrothele bispora (strain CBS 962.96) TaxID=1314807 RepID=A0A4V4HGH6_DENBC|nr:hypothetical protein K435DRAFT_795339 [Dendrothele bispora CBS 962.96]
MSLAESQAPTTSASHLKTAQPRVKICDRCYGDEVVVEAGGVKCNFHGLRTLHGYKEYIIVTTEEWGGTFVKVKGVIDPGHELVEGRAEMVGKKLLKREVSVDSECAADELFLILW